MIGKALGLAVMAIGISPSIYCAVEYDSLNKDLEIMENILKTALSQKDKKKAICFQSISSLYLADQGVLFEVSTSGDRSHYGSMFHSLSQFVPPVPPIPAIKFHNGDGLHMMEINVNTEDTERYIEKIEAMAEEFERDFEQHQQIIDIQREVEWALKEKKRQLKDRNFETNHADGKRKKALEKEIATLKQELEALSAQAKKIASEKQEYEVLQRERAAEQRELYRSNVNDFFTDFETVVSETLCRYGSGLKALPVEENITFRVKNLGYDEDETKKKKRDKVYVFSKKSVKRCVEDKINPRQFMGEAQKYIY